MRLLLALPLVLMAFAASAQSDPNSACARDVSRHCRAQMGSGDMVILSCLQQHRARLSKACDKLLTDHGR